MKRTIYAHHFGKSGPLGHRYGMNAAALLETRGWTVTKRTRSYVYLLPPPGVRVSHDTPVEIDAPSDAQILEQATAAHEKASDQSGEMVTDAGVWPWRYKAYRSEVIMLKTTLLDAQGAHHGTKQTRIADTSPCRASDSRRRRADTGGTRDAFATAYRKAQAVSRLHPLQAVVLSMAAALELELTREDRKRRRKKIRALRTYGRADHGVGSDHDETRTGDGDADGPRRPPRAGRRGRRADYQVAEVGPRARARRAGAQKAPGQAGRMTGVSTGHAAVARGREAVDLWPPSRPLGPEDLRRRA